MAVFKDANGKEWIIKLHAPLIREVREQCGIDLASIETFQKLAEDPVLLVNVLWCCVRKQSGSITDEQFGESLVGDSIERATEALLTAFQDFCPASTRNLIAKAMTKARGVEARQNELMEALLNQHFAEQEAKLSTQLQNATAVRESSALVQKN